MQPRLPLLSLLLVHLSSMLPKVLVSLHIQLHQVADFDWVDFTSPAVTDLMDCFAEDVLVLVLVDVFALIVRFDGQLHLLHRSLLCVQLLQILVWVFAVVVPARIAPGDGGRGLCTGVQVGGVMKGELTRTDPGRRGQRGRRRDL